jgi:hypothetical protein
VGETVLRFIMNTIDFQRFSGFDGVRIQNFPRLASLSNLRRV